MSKKEQPSKKATILKRLIGVLNMVSIFNYKVIKNRNSENGGDH